MFTLHEMPKNGKPIKFIGIVGKAGPRQTAYGWAIDIADNSVRPCKWVDTIPKEPQSAVDFARGDLVEVEGVILVNDKRPLIYGTVTVLRN